MNAQHREDAVMRALEILPEQDAAHSDPRFLKNPALTDEARASRETAVDVWLAVSPLQVAPPGILDRVMAEVRTTPATAAPRGAITWRTAVASGGWAAALVLGGMLLFRQAPPVTVTTQAPSTPSKLPERPGRATIAEPVITPPPTTMVERKMQDEIARLKRALEEQERQGILPRIRGLSAPGMAAATPERARQDLNRMLVEALRTSLEARTGAPGDTAALVIERGWLPEGFPPIQDGQTIRHRHFPEDSWEQYGLLKSSDGNYYDASNQLIWTPDPEGRGFIGRRVSADDKVDEIKAESESHKLDLQKATAPATFTNASPSGILIEDPANSSVSAIIEGVSPPSGETSQWALVTNNAGQSFSVQVTADMFSPSGTLLVPFGTNYGSLSIGSGISVGSTSFGSGVASFELQTRDANGTVTGTIIQGGN